MWWRCSWEMSAHWSGFSGTLLVWLEVLQNCHLRVGFPPPTGQKAIGREALLHLRQGSGIHPYICREKQSHTSCLFKHDQRTALISRESHISMVLGFCLHGSRPWLHTPHLLPSNELITLVFLPSFTIVMTHACSLVCPMLMVGSETGKVEGGFRNDGKHAQNQL